MGGKPSESDRDTIIRAFQVAAAELKSTRVPASALKRITGITKAQVERRFGTYNRGVGAAGLTPVTFARLDDDVLLHDMYDVLVKVGHLPTVWEFRMAMEGKHSMNTYFSHFGARWEDVLAALRDWLEGSGQSLPWLEELPARDNTPGSTDRRTRRNLGGTRQAGSGIAPPPNSGVLNFRGLLYSPVNEQEVVLLFGMVFNDLGFVVESVSSSAYPDCQAKRWESRKGGRRRHVRIEFEHRSSGFRDQGHNPEGCDLIVCWEHDWQECPIEVLELKSTIRSLKG